MYRLFILIKSTFINSIMKQNERDKFTARLFKNRQKKQLKILNYNQSKAKKWTALIFFCYPLDIFIHLKVARLNNLPH